MFKIIKTSTYKAMRNELILNSETLRNALTEHIKLIRENGELQKQLHHLTAKKLPIKKSKDK